MTISLPLMKRRAWIQNGGCGSGTLRWSVNGHETGSIGYSYNMGEPDYGWMELRFTWTPYGREPQPVTQRIALSCSRPNYGGQRWWLLCPVTNERVTKLHLPPGGGKFASREAWGLGYKSQRVSRSDRTLQKLFKLQEKLGGELGWDQGLSKPKGMWRRTYDQHLEQYHRLDGMVTVDMMRMFGMLA